MAEPPGGFSANPQSFPEPDPLGAQINPDMGGTFSKYVAEAQEAAKATGTLGQAVRQLTSQMRDAVKDAVGGATGTLSNPLSSATSRISEMSRNAFSRSSPGKKAESGNWQQAPSGAYVFTGGGGGGQPPNGGRRGSGSNWPDDPNMPDPNSGRVGQVAKYYIASAGVSAVSRGYQANQNYAYSMRPLTATLGGMRGMDARDYELWMRNNYNNKGVVRGPEDLVSALPTLTYQLGGPNSAGGRAAQYFSNSELSLTGGAQVAAGIDDPQLMMNLRRYGVHVTRDSLSDPKKLVENVLRRANGGRAVTAEDLSLPANSRFRQNLQTLVGDQAEAFVRAGLDSRGIGGRHDQEFDSILKTERQDAGSALQSAEATLDVMKQQKNILSDIRGLLARMGGGYPAALGGALTSGIGESILPWTILNVLGKVGVGAAATKGLGALWKGAKGLIGIGGAGSGGVGPAATSAASKGVGGLSKLGRFLGNIGLGIGWGSSNVGSAIGPGAEFDPNWSNTQKQMWRMANPNAPLPDGFPADLARETDAFLRERGLGDPPGGSGGLAMAGGWGASGSGALLMQRTSKDSSHVSGLQPEFRRRLEMMFQANPKLTLTSGYRSPEHQKRLWEEALKKYGSPEKARKWVAPPGRSNHNRGLAADIGPSSEYAWIKANVGRYGLEVPLANEPWHVEPKGLRSGREQVAMEMEASPATNANAGVGGGSGSVLNMSTRVDLSGGNAVLMGLLGGGGLGSPGAAIARGNLGGGLGSGPMPDFTGAAGSAAAGKRLSDQELMGVLQQAGFSGQGLITAFAVAKAESGGFAGAHNPNAKTGDNSYGLFQINMLGKLGPARRKQYGLSSNEDLFDPILNARIAYEMSGGGSSWGHWSVHPESKSRGAKGSGYEQYLDDARTLIGAGVGDPATPGAYARGGGSVVMGGPKTVTINIYPQNNADALTIARQVQRILRDEDNFETVGSV